MTPLFVRNSVTRGRQRLGEGINDFAGSSVVEFFTRLVLDSARILLQTFNMSLQSSVFTLQLLHLNAESVLFLSFAGKSCQSVVAQYNAVRHTDSKASHNERRPATAPRKQARAQTPRRFR